MDMVFLNSALLKANEARIGIDERGFRFGDGVFETVPVHEGRPYLLDYHLARMQEGLNALQIASNIAMLLEPVRQVLEANNARQAVMRIYVSRGVGSQGYLPTLPAPAPTVLIQLLPLPDPVKEPVTLWLSTWEKISPRALPMQSKLAQGANAMLARMQAHENACYDALQKSYAGHVSEASSANIFWVKGDRLYTPSLATGALAGVTRRRLMELAGTVTEGEFALAELREADAVFLTNATFGIVPVAALQPLGFRWESASISERFKALRRRDMQAGL